MRSCDGNDGELSQGKGLGRFLGGGIVVLVLKIM